MDNWLCELLLGNDSDEITRDNIAKSLLQRYHLVKSLEDGLNYLELSVHRKVVMWITVGTPLDQTLSDDLMNLLSIHTQQYHKRLSILGDYCNNQE